MDVGLMDESNEWELGNKYSCMNMMVNIMVKYDGFVMFCEYESYAG